MEIHIPFRYLRNLWEYWVSEYLKDMDTALQFGLSHCKYDQILLILKILKIMHDEKWNVMGKIQLHGINGSLK